MATTVVHQSVHAHAHPHAHVPPPSTGEHTLTTDIIEEEFADGQRVADGVEGGDGLIGSARRRSKSPQAVPFPPFYLEIYNYIAVVLSWASWLPIAILLSADRRVRRMIVFTTILRIVFNLLCFGFVRLLRYIGNYGARLEHANNATSYVKWLAHADDIDHYSGKDPWRDDAKTGEYDHALLARTLDSLRESRGKRNCREVGFLLQTVLHRHFCGLDDPRLHMVARAGTKHIIEDFVEEVGLCIKYFSEHECLDHSPHEKAALLERIANSQGRTALMLSGGGTLAMYHLGVVKALLETDLMPRIISGTSGGSIVAAMMALKTDKELLEDVIKPDIATRYGHEWFRPLSAQIRHFMKNGVLVDAADFNATTRAYYGEWTFKEAYERTGRIVNIAVTKSDAASHPVILNCLNTPDVLLWSAVTASCAIPGLMVPATLYAKDKHGKTVPAYPGGVKWMDGSITADIPMNVVRRQFNVNQFIVSQTNPHIAPFVQNADNSMWPLERFEVYLTNAIRHKVTTLCQMGLMPTLFGQDVSGIFLQTYTSTTRSDITIVPALSLYDHFKIISHPTVEDMRRYIHKGAAAAYPRIPLVRHRLINEQRLAAALRASQARAEELSRDPRKHLSVPQSRLNRLNSV